FEGQLGDPGQAVSAYRRALEAEPATMEALSALERLYRRQQQWPELIDILQQKASIVEDTEQVIALKHDIGSLYEERLRSARNAISSYREILTVDPQNLPALKALERLYEQTGAMEKYLDVLEQQLDFSGNNEERISLYERMAVAWEEQFRKPERAWESLEKILLINDRHEPTLMSLERLYRQERRAPQPGGELPPPHNTGPDPATRLDVDPHT